MNHPRDTTLVSKQHHRMTRVLTSFSMILVLLLTMASTGLVSYKKVYGAAPTSDFGTKIREVINNQIGDEPSTASDPSNSLSFSVVKFTLSGFPHQIGKSVTDIDLRPSPCPGEDDEFFTCSGGIKSVILSFFPSSRTPLTAEGSASVRGLFFSPSVVILDSSILFPEQGKNIPLTLPPHFNGEIIPTLHLVYFDMS